MISFAPTEDQQSVVDTVQRYVREKVQRLRHDADEDEAIRMQWWKKAGVWVL